MGPKIWELITSEENQISLSVKKKKSKDRSLKNVLAEHACIT